MKKQHSILLYLSLIILPLAGQSQCKWKTSEKDAFTDDIHLLSKKMTVDGDKSSAPKNFFAYFFLDRSGSSYSIKMEYVEYVLMDKEINDFVLRIKTKEGLIELNPSTDATFEYNPTPYTKVITKYNLTEEQVNQLKSGITIMGITYSGSERRFKEKEKDYQKLMEYIQCAIDFQ